MNNDKNLNKDIAIKSNSRGNDISTRQKKLLIKRTGKPVKAQLTEIGSVYLLVDCSGSMDIEEKIEQAKSGALNFAIDAIDNNYKVGLIEFNYDAYELCEPSRDIELLEHKINLLIALGDTNMASAIFLANSKLTMENERKRGRLVMVIITDGKPNSESAALNQADCAKSNNIDIITIGTDDADEDFLSKLASKSELVKMVSRNNLATGINSAAKLLPKPRSID